MQILKSHPREIGHHTFAPSTLHSPDGCVPDRKHITFRIFRHSHAFSIVGDRQEISRSTRLIHVVNNHFPSLNYFGLEL